MIWKFALEMASPAADPINYGWPEEEGRLLPVMLPQNVALVPDEVLQMIRCGCVLTHPCSTAKCNVSWPRCHVHFSANVIQDQTTVTIIIPKPYHHRKVKTHE